MTARTSRPQEIADHAESAISLTVTTNRPDVDLVVECVHCGDVATLTGWTDATEVAARRLADEHLAERHSDDLTFFPVFR